MQSGIEWLETDGLGGFASGTVGGVRTRRYHALLCAALAPPTARHVLVNGCDVFVATAAGRQALSSQKYVCESPEGEIVVPDGTTRLVDFTSEPWPTWTFRLEDGTEITQELFSHHAGQHSGPPGVRHDGPLVALSWRVTKQPRRAKKAAPVQQLELLVRPFLTGRDHHALHHENRDFRFDAEIREGARPRVKGRRARTRTTSPDTRVAWRPYADLPGVEAAANGTYRHEPHWYNGFLYDEERARGFDAVEDCGAPGEFRFDLARLPRNEAFLLLAAEMKDPSRRVSLLELGASASSFFESLRRGERRRRRTFASPLERAADAYIVQRGSGKTIIAGYPWFTDWGRDTLISLRGLCLATGRHAEARAILLEWSALISDGMVPNRFPDHGDAPEYNTVDGSLWYVIAVQEYLAATKRARGGAKAVAPLLAACAKILEGHANGTRFGIRMDLDGLLAAGMPGQQLTWMDARADGREVTPRIGKPVEVQALWLNALAFVAKALPERDDRKRWKERFERGRRSFAARFWNADTSCLHDVVDVDHRPGTVDPSIRPNQLLALGALPVALIEGDPARKALAVVEELLLTPMGLCTLAPDDPRYRGRYQGGPSERDGAYHQGSVWPWLIGPFVDAWLHVHGDTARNRRNARERYVTPLVDLMRERGVFHLPELADGDAPHAPRGTPFQAWSLGELLRLERRLGTPTGRR